MPELRLELEYIIELRDVAADTSVSNRELDKHLKQIKDHSSALGH